MVSDQDTEDQRFAETFEAILNRIYPSVRVVPVEGDLLCKVRHFVPAVDQVTNEASFARVQHELAQAGYASNGCLTFVGSYSRVIMARDPVNGEVEITSHAPPLVGFGF
jgi:hypothetical protein